MTDASLPDPRVTLVVLTYQRRDEVLRSVAQAVALPERVAVVVVDNASTDGTAEALAERFPQVELVRLPRNVGAAARNAGAARARTPYVAFCDDDCWWAPGSLARAADLLDAHPAVAVLSARIRVGPEGRLDAVCEHMAASPLDSTGLPGPAVVGFMAGACVMRRRAFEDAGRYEPRLFLGGEEQLLALDLLAAGWQLVYCADITVHHHPSRQRDAARRRRLTYRNGIWVAWLRRPLPVAWAITRWELARARAQGQWGRTLAQALAGAPWVLWNRREVPARVEAMRRRVETAGAASPPQRERRADIADGRPRGDGPPRAA